MSDCGVSKDDVVAGELLELAHESAGPVFLAMAGFVEAGSEIVEACVGVR